MSRICPNDAFAIAHNGLNIFLTEYPHMNEEQREEIRQLVESFSKPGLHRKKIRRPALICQARQDGSILITPNIVRTIQPPDPNTPA